MQATPTDKEDHLNPKKRKLSSQAKKSTTATPKRSRKSNTSPQTSDQPTRQELIDDLLKVQEAHPDATLTRNFYRVHGKFSEGIWQGFFGRFSDFRKAAGMEPDPSAVKKETKETIDDSGIVYSEKYIYNPSTDSYITFLDRSGKRIFMSGDQHRSMLAAYSNWDGQPQTINEICRTFSIRRDWFNEYKTCHGWTHDKEPFTDEELMERPAEDMVQDVLQAKRLSLFKKAEKAKWNETQKNSENWINFEQSVFIPLIAHIQKNAPKHRAPMISMGRSREKFGLVVAPFDLHYGKYGWADEVGESYTRKEAREALLHHTNQIAKQVAGFGRPEKIICASASDYFHVDNGRHETTAGTRQDVDGTRTQILIEGCELAVEHAEMLAQIAPLEWIGVPGNHDRDSAVTAMLYMSAWFRNNKHVTVDVSPKMRRAVTYGNSFLGFFHGHGVKVGDLQAVMQKEFRDLWRNTDKHYAFSGHLHHEVVREIHGIKHYQVSSLAGKDRWTSDNGYITSDRAMQGYMVSQNRGIIAEFISPVIDSAKVTGVRIRK